ncbi:prepilin-type N-terminal cleavage/methylation domain-containing protein [Lentisphaerota bacterium WC36G]|nr:hypothetical protein LJT99_12570 [Lentisphaerae bacterium WC36]
MKRYKIKYFSLIEIIASMAIFTVLMLMMMNFFGKTQGLMTKRSSQAAQYADAQASLDLIGRQLNMYNDFDYTNTNGQLNTLEVGPANDELYFYTNEKGTVNGAASMLKLVGIRFDNTNNKLQYRERNLLPSYFTSDPLNSAAFQVDPSANFPSIADSSKQSFSNQDNTTYDWEDVIDNVVEFNVVRLNASGAVATGTNKIASIRLTIVTINDEDARKYRGMTNAAISAADINESKKIITEKPEDFDFGSLSPEQKVLANSIRSFSKMVFLGYRK